MKYYLNKNVDRFRILTGCKQLLYNLKIWSHTYILTTINNVAYIIVKSKHCSILFWSKSKKWADYCNFIFNNNGHYNMMRLNYYLINVKENASYLIIKYMTFTCIKRWSFCWKHWKKCNLFEYLKVYQHFDLMWKCTGLENLSLLYMNIVPNNGMLSDNVVEVTAHTSAL